LQPIVTLRPRSLWTWIPLRTILRKALPRLRTKRPAAIRPLRLRPLRTTLRRLRITSTVHVLTLRPARLKTGPAISIALRLIRSKIATPRRPPLTIALTARLSRLPRPAWLRFATLRIIARGTAHKAPVAPHVKFVPGDLAIAFAIQLLQYFRRIFHLLGVDHTIVIRIEHVEERGPEPASIATLSIRPRPGHRRQSLRRIGWLRRLRRIVLRTER
jgi:hypothetical protein